MQLFTFSSWLADALPKLDCQNKLCDLINLPEQKQLENHDKAIGFLILQLKTIFSGIPISSLKKWITQKHLLE